MPQKRVRGVSPDGRRSLVVPKTGEIIPRDPPLRRETTGNYGKNIDELDKIWRSLTDVYGQTDPETSERDPDGYDDVKLNKMFQDIISDPVRRKRVLDDTVGRKLLTPQVFQVPPAQDDEDIKRIKGLR